MERDGVGVLSAAKKMIQECPQFGKRLLKGTGTETDRSATGLETRYRVVKKRPEVIRGVQFLQDYCAGTDNDFQMALFKAMLRYPGIA